MRRQRRGSRQREGRRDHHGDDCSPKADLQRLQQFAENTDDIAERLDQIGDGFSLDPRLERDRINPFRPNRPRFNA